jgi:hypothetical protein
MEHTNDVDWPPPRLVPPRTLWIVIPAGMAPLAMTPAGPSVAREVVFVTVIVYADAAPAPAVPGPETAAIPVGEVTLAARPQRPGTDLAAIRFTAGPHPADIHGASDCCSSSGTHRDRAVARRGE